MRHEISKDRKTLTIIVDADEREMLERDEDIQSDKAMIFFMEPIVCNSELEWIEPAETGDLTSAPMLGIYSEEREANQPGDIHPRKRITGYHDGKAWCQDVSERWAFLDYQVRSVLEDLRDKGRAVFVS